MKINELNKKIIILDNVLTQEDCENLINFYNTKGTFIEKFRDVYPMPINLNEKFLFLNVEKIIKNINDLLKNKLKIDWCQIVKWPENSLQSDHFDNAETSTVFTSITYLNTNFIGGKTYFVNDIEIVPKIGRTIYFDGKYYKHGVTRVEKDTRYVLPIWYKLNE